MYIKETFHCWEDLEVSGLRPVKKEFLLGPHKANGVVAWLDEPTFPHNK